MVTSLALTTFPTSLVAALLCGGTSGGSLQTPSLIAALPADTVMAVRLPNPKALVAQRETNSWVGFAMDAQWDVLLPKMFRGVDEPEMAAEAPAWRKSILGALGDSSEVVGFLSGSVEQGVKPTAGLLVRGGEACSELLREFMGADAVETKIPGDHTVSISEAGRAELFYEKNGLILVLSSDSVEHSKEVAARCLASIARGKELAGPFAITGLKKVRQSTAGVELAIDLRSVWQMVSEDWFPEPEPDTIGIGGGSGEQQKVLRKVFGAASSMEWVYMDWTFGLGETADLNVHVPYDTNSLAGDFFGFFGEADPTLFEEVPASAISATVARVDVHGLTNWALGQVKEFSEEVHGQVQGGLAAGQAAIGLDIVEDLIGSMTGDFLGFSTVPDTEESSGMIMAMAGTGPATLVTMIDDSAPWVELVEAALAMSGMDSEFASEAVELGKADAEFEVWKASESLGLPLTLGVGDGRVMISIDEVAGGAYLELLKNGATGATITSNDVQRKAMKSASGSIITWQPTGSGAEVMESLGGLMEGLVAEEMNDVADGWEGELDEEAVGEILESMSEMQVEFESAFEGMAGLWREYFNGTVMTEVHLDGGMVRMHSLAR